MLKLGDKLELIIIYDDAPNSGVPDKTVPGVVRGPDGNLYKLVLIDN